MPSGIKYMYILLEAGMHQKTITIEYEHFHPSAGFLPYSRQNEARAAF